MTLSQIIPMFIAMVVLAVIPGPGVLTVVSRSIVSGYKQGVVTTLGILCGDYIFIILSLYGLAAIAVSMEGLFQIIKLAGVIYLCWLGINLIVKKPDVNSIQLLQENSSFKNFSLGLITTLSNPKAIVFYVSFFPAFINLHNLHVIDIGICILVVTFAVGSVMVGYAYLANRVSNLFNSTRAQVRLNRVAGCIMLGSGSWLAMKI